MLFGMEAKIVRGQILNGEPRIDGRDTRTVRPITIRTGVLPRTHGSALFTRGETQALVVATLGTERDEQNIDALQGEYSDRFMLHYNMPPFATGETGRVGTPKRREIGHGRLAKRALVAVLPSEEEFGYSIRVVSRNHRIQRFVVDGFGVRRLPVADGRRRADQGARGRYRHGPDQGRQQVCRADRHPGRRRSPRRHGLQGGRHRQGHHRAADGHQDHGITKEIMQVALAQAKEGRMHILGKMKAGDAGARDRKLSDFAPRMITMKINPEKIRDVIGKGGSVIRALTEETGTTIDIDDEGIITIACMSGEGRRRPRSASKTSRPKSKSARCMKARCSSCWTSARWSTSCRARTVCCTSPKSRTSASRTSPIYLKEGQIVQGQGDGTG